VGLAELQFIDVERRGAVLFGAFDRPERHNSCSLEEHREFAGFLRAVQRDPEIKAAVVTGKGRSFSIGGDIELMRGVTDDPGSQVLPLLEDARELVLAHIELEKPIVAAMNGWAMGSGAIFGLLCDIIVAERSTRIADGHTRAGLVAGDGGVVLWPLAIGLTQAKRLLLTGDAVSGEEALRLGLVTELVEDGQAVGRALAIAERMCTGPEFAMRMTKRALNRWLALSWSAIGEHAMALEGLSMGTPEASAAIAALARDGRPAIDPDPT